MNKLLSLALVVALPSWASAAPARSRVTVSFTQVGHFERSDGRVFTTVGSPPIQRKLPLQAIKTFETVSIYGQYFRMQTTAGNMIAEKVTVKVPGKGTITYNPYSLQPRNAADILPTTLKAIEWQQRK